MRGQHHEVALEPGQHQIRMLPSSQGDIRYVTLWITLILGAKLLHIFIASNINNIPTYMWFSQCISNVCTFRCVMIDSGLELS